jgi:hypothetical protein
LVRSAASPVFLQSRSQAPPGNGAICVPIYILWAVRLSLEGGFPEPDRGRFKLQETEHTRWLNHKQSAIHAIGIWAAETFTVSTVGKSTTSAIGANRKQIVVFAVTGCINLMFKPADAPGSVGEGIARTMKERYAPLGGCALRA